MTRTSSRVARLRQATHRTRRAQVEAATAALRRLSRKAARPRTAVGRPDGQPPT